MQTFAKNAGENSSGETITDLDWSDSILRLSQMESVLFVTLVFEHG
jgi:hypothetical protein